MRKTIAGLTLVALSACTSAAVGPDKEALCGARPSHTQTQNAVKVYVDSAGLEDPSSAQVRDVRVEHCTSWHRGLFKGGATILAGAEDIITGGRSRSSSIRDTESADHIQASGLGASS
jgi:hypothetical protein